MPIDANNDELEPNQPDLDDDDLDDVDDDDDMDVDDDAATVRAPDVAPGSEDGAKGDASDDMIDDDDDNVGRDVEDIKPI